MKKTTSLFCSLALSLVAASASYGQIVLYGTNFDGTANATQFNDTTAYTNSNTSGADLVGQGSATFGGPWVGNDDPSTQEGTSNTYHGGLNQVLPNTVGSGLGGQLEGQEVVSGITVLPGQASVYVAHPVTLTALAKANSVSLDTDFNVSTSANNFNSSYGFSLQTSAFANILSIQLVRDPANVNTRDIIQYQIGTATAVNNGNGIALNQNYHLKITVNMVANTFSATYGGLAVFSNISLGATSAMNIAEIAATEFGNTGADGNGGFTGSGQDTLTFDNISFTVPEPSTYAAMVVGGLGLAGVMRFRRRQA